MTNNAMEKAWETHRLHGLRAIPTWEDVVEGIEQQSFAAGYQARDAEVADLKSALAERIDYATKAEQEIAELMATAADGAELKRALRLACAGVRVIETHPAPGPWLELTLDDRVAHFIELAQKEP